MLSAFHARPLVELKARDKSRVESILAYGDRLLVGLNTGVLRIYRTKEFTDDPPDDEDGDQPKPKIDLLREEDKFSKKPIQQLAIVKEANVLISLSDAHVSFHDLQNYALIERLEKTKGATSFAVISNVVKDSETGIPSIVSRLAVAVKRKVMIWSWQDMEASEHVEETTLPSTVKLITWATGSSLVAGMDPGYVLVDLLTGNLTDVNRTIDQGEAAGVRFGAVNSSGMGYMGMGSWVPKPLATKLQDGEMLLAKDVNTLFIDLDGKPVPKRQVPWATAPDAVGFSYPYLLSLATTRGVLELRNPETLSLLQSIKLPDVTIMHVPQPNISLAHAGKGFLVASDRCIWRMSAVDYPSQIGELTSRGLFDETLSLVGMLEDTLIEDKEGILRQIKIQKAHHLFDKRKYRDSLDLFAAAGAPPAKVIELYPPLIAGSFSKHHHDDAEAAYGDAENERPDTPDKVASSNGAATVVRKIKTAASLEGSEVAKPEKEPFSMQEKELKYAVNELCAFLAQTRVQLQRHMNYDGTLKDPSTAQHSRPPYFTLVAEDYHNVSDWRMSLFEVATLVDTTLFRAYMFARPQLAGPLFRLDNFCSPEVVEEKLYESGKYIDLIDFLYGKKLHKQALELLEKFGKGGDGIDSSEVDEALRGPRRIISYLQQLPFEMIDLILQFAEWPIRKDPDLGMHIFVADTENAENLPRQRVLDFLENIDHNLARGYLEHVIDELGDDTTEFHDRLITLYLERLVSGSAAADSTADTVVDSTIDQAAHDQIQDKLEGLLRTSKHYTLQTALKSLPVDNAAYYESRATVLSRLHRHREALQIYVFDMQDYPKAEEYCNATYLENTISPLAPTSSKLSPSTTAVVDPDDPSQSHSVYTTLLSLYLTPPTGHKENLDAALALLSHHGSRLPALSTLNLLPTKLPIKNLEEYFRGRMRAAYSLAREEAIVAALSRVEKTTIEAALLIGNDEAPSGGSIAKGRNRRVVLEENRLCAVCNKRFGRAAVRVYPDGEVTHYGCVDVRRGPDAQPVGSLPRSLPGRGIGVRG